MNIEILNSVTLAFAAVYAFMSILFAVVKTARARLLPCIILLALINIALQAIGGRWLIVGLYLLISLPFFIVSFSDRYVEHIESDENPEGQTDTSGIMAVAVDGEPKGQ